MAIKRVVDVSFWKDSTVLDEYSVEDKYFMLYLFTCPNSELLGMYKSPIKIMSFETGYTVEVIRVLLERFESKYNIIVYDYETQEIFIKNYIKKSIIKGGKPIYDAFLMKWNVIKSNKLKKSFLEHHANNKIENKTLFDFLSHINNLKSDDSDNDFDYDNDYDNDYDRYVGVSYTDTGTDTVKKTIDKSELDNSVNLLKETYSKYFKTISKKFTTKKVKDKVEKILKENKVDFNCVVKGLDNYLKSCVDEKDRLTNDITYIRNCERFLNEELWNDFLEDIDYSKQKKSGVKTIGSTESWNKVEERELTEEEKKEMKDIIKKMKGNN